MLQVAHSFISRCARKQVDPDNSYVLGEKKRKGDTLLLYINNIYAAFVIVLGG